MKKISSLVIVLLCSLIVSVGFDAPYVRADTTEEGTYGAGDYGECDYGTCTITLTSDGSTAIDVLPDASGKCTVQSDVASVLTDNTNGYMLTMTTNTTDNTLVGTSDNINPSTGTSAAPVTLATNTWGYRVDGVGSFGAGPTSAQSNGATPSVTFAGVPASNETPATIATTSSPANPAVDTTVWYGVCVDAGIPSGTYSTTILYTAVIN